MSYEDREYQIHCVHTDDEIALTQLVVTPALLESLSQQSPVFLNTLALECLEQTETALNRLCASFYGTYEKHRDNIDDLYDQIDNTANAYIPLEFDPHNTEYLEIFRKSLKTLEDLAGDISRLFRISTDMTPARFEWIDDEPIPSTPKEYLNMQSNFDFNIWRKNRIAAADQELTERLNARFRQALQNLRFSPLEIETIARKFETAEQHGLTPEDPHIN